MDLLNNLRPDPEVLREPRGFMRIVQIVLAIFAFGTITSVRTTSQISVNCTQSADPDVREIKIKYGYPFRIQNTAGVMAPFCSDNQVFVTDVFTANFSSSAQFFCFIGVLSFLILIVLVPAYVFVTPFFAKGGLAAKVDFIGSCVWTLMWFIASTAWAANMSKLTAYMDPANLIVELGVYCNSPFICMPKRPGDPSTLVVSVLFGFLNMGLSGASLWFLFKETEWHHDKEGEQGAPGDIYADPGFQTPEYTSDPTVPADDMSGTGMQSSFGSQSGGVNDYYGSGQPTY